VDAVEAEVRELVRRRGLDPFADQAAMRRLVDEVVTDYDERSLTSSLPPLPDPRSAARAVYDSVAGFGPLQRHLDDPSVEELWINEPGRVFVAKRGRSELTTTILNDGQVRDLVEKMLKTTGRRVDLSTPFVDAMLPDGSRLHVVIPDITRRHWSVNIRKFVLSANSLDELVGLGTLTPQAARFLEASIIAGLNIIVAGGTQAGKTTLLNCLASAIPGRERVITCEEVFELKIPLPDVVAMQTRQPNLEGTGEIQLRRLVKEALRMRPDRIIVGEVRQEECLDLLAWCRRVRPDHRLPGAAGRLRVTEAARQAAGPTSRRPTATLSSAPRLAADLAMRDQIPDVGPASVSYPGGPPALAPGQTVTVQVAHEVTLPILGALLGAAEPTIPVRATHVEVVDAFSEAP
jgi:pilus assembly protein CpaF